MKLRHLVFVLALTVLVLSALETQKEGLMHRGASPYNIRWDGSSNFVKQLSLFGSVDIVNDWTNLNLRNYIDYSCRTIFIISPEQKFSHIEINAITDLVKEKMFNLVILDEGPYSNDLIKSLGLSVSIEAFKYVDILRQRQGFAGAVPGFIELGTTYYVLFSYVSPINIGNISNCEKIAYTVEGNIVGVLCRLENSSVLIIGDGSIAINAVLPPPPIKNVYADIIERIVNVVCREESKRVISLVDASKFKLRVLTFDELLEEGYSGIEAFMLTFNPFRYLYPYLYDKELYLISGSSTAIAVFFAIAILRTSRKIRMEVSEESRREIFIFFPGYGRIALEVLVNLCRSHKQCVKEVPCIMRKVNDRCIKQLNNYMSKNRDFRRKVLEKILLS